MKKRTQTNSPEEEFDDEEIELLVHDFSDTLEKSNSTKDESVWRSCE